MFRLSVVAVLLSALLAAPVSAVAETKIGVVNLRQALFSSNEARSFTEKLQSDFADEEEGVREAQEEARKVKERIEKDAAMMNEEERKQLAGEFQEALKEFNYRKEKLDSAVAKRKQEFLDEPVRKWIRRSRNCWMRRGWTWCCLPRQWSTSSRPWI